MEKEKYKIPCEVITFKESDTPPDIDVSQGMEYEPVKGEKIIVRFWVRYPSYDFLFGVPDPSNRCFEKEISFFQYRDTRIKKVMAGMYLDKAETEEMIEGFSKVLEFSKQHSLHLWKKI